MLPKLDKAFVGLMSLAMFCGPLTCPASESYAQFTTLGYLPGADPGSIGRMASSNVIGMSADGSVVIGTGTDSNRKNQSFLWTNKSGMSPLGMDGTTSSRPLVNGISADGKTVVGMIVRGSYQTSAFSWTASKGFTDLGKLGGYTANAVATSADGSVIAGESNGHVFRWTASSGMVDLGTLPGYTQDNIATGVSADGKVIVGYSSNQTFVINHYSTNGQAFRWTQATGLVGLGFLLGGNVNYFQQGSYAAGVSADGSVIAGYSSKNGDIFLETFRWTQQSGMVGLGAVSGDNFSFAKGISADGKVIVGVSRKLSSGYDYTQQAFRWSAVTGMQSVADWLQDAGVSVPSNMHLTSAVAANADGSILIGNANEVGTSGNVQAWMARVGANGSGLMTDVGSFYSGLAESNQRAVLGVGELSNLAVVGAHRRSLLNDGQVLGQHGACAWAVTSAADYDESRTHARLAEIGACKELGPARVGLGIGKAWGKQDWALGGSGKYNGQYLLAELASKFGEHIEASLLGYRGDFDINTRRNYMNGASVDTSRADIDATATAARVRLDWIDLLHLSRFILSPYVIYDWSKANLPAYTESGGGFPSVLRGANWSTSEARIGVTNKIRISTSVELRFVVEAVRRVNGNSNAVTGQVTGLFDFALPSQRLKRNWANAYADFEYHLTPASGIVLSTNGSTSGGDANWGASARYYLSF